MTREMSCTKMSILMYRCPLKITGKADTNGLLWMEHPENGTRLEELKCWSTLHVLAFCIKGV